MGDAPPWLRPLGTLAVASALTAGAAPALAQEDAPVTGRVDLTGAPVDLHEGTCADLSLDPWASVGRLERQTYGALEAPVDDAALADEPAEAEEDAGFAIEDPDDIGVLEGGEITETGREGDPVEEAAEAAVEVGEEITDELVEDDPVAIERSSDELIEAEREGDVAIDEAEAAAADEELVDESAAALIEDDVEGEIDPPAETGTGAYPAPALYVTEGEVAADFETLFDQPNVIAVHRSSEAYESIVACGLFGGIVAPGEDEIVVGIGAVDGSGVRGYAVFESDPALFGDDTTALSVYLFDHLPTRGDAARTATPAP